MPTPQELLEEWQDGETNGMRPRRLQKVREDMVEATGEAIPRRIGDIRGILQDPNWRGVITRKLRDAVEESEGE